NGVVVGPEVHEEQPRLLIQHVAMKSSYLDAVGTERLDDRVDLARHHHEIARYSGFAAARRLKTDSGCQTHRTSRRDRHSVHRDRIAARHAELIDATVGLTLGTDYLVELRGIKINGRRLGGCGGCL